MRRFIYLVDIQNTSPSGGWGYHLTTALSEVQYNGKTYIPAPLRLSEAKFRGTESVSFSIEIGMAIRHQIPNLFSSLILSDLIVQIGELNLDTDDYTLIARGQVSAVERTKDVLRLTIQAFSPLEYDFPPLSFSSLCPHRFCDRNCGVVLNDIVLNVTSYSVSNDLYTLTSDAFSASPYPLKGGVVEVITEDFYGVYIIADHSGNKITLVSPFTAPSTPPLKLYPACDKTLESCQKFNNVRHFAGFPFIPSINPVTSGFKVDD